MIYPHCQWLPVKKSILPTGISCNSFAVTALKDTSKVLFKTCKVELIVGKMVQVGEGNRYFFNGKIEEETIKGWGFPRYNVSTPGPMAGTLMAIDPNAPKVNRFITLGGDAFLIRCNSRLPIVVYAPEGVEVRYRVWRAEPEPKVIERV